MDPSGPCGSATLIAGRPRSTKVVERRGCRRRRLDGDHATLPSNRARRNGSGLADWDTPNQDPQHGAAALIDLGDRPLRCSELSSSTNVVTECREVGGCCQASFFARASRTPNSDAERSRHCHLRVDGLQSTCGARVRKVSKPVSRSRGRGVAILESACIAPR